MLAFGRVPMSIEFSSLSLRPDTKGLEHSPGTTNVLSNCFVVIKKDFSPFQVFIIFNYVGEGGKSLT